MRHLRIFAIGSLTTLALGAALVPAIAQSAGGDAAKGKTVFARCMACHAVTPGTNRIGPSLAGVVGRKAGSAPGFTYSPAMKGSKTVWNAKALDGFLARPSGASVPGTKMAFAGVPNATDRANVIAYLGTLR